MPDESTVETQMFKDNSDDTNGKSLFGISSHEHKKTNLEIVDNKYQGELVEILDEGNIKLVPPSESASNDKNFETICLPQESQVRVITSKNDKRGPDHELRKKTTKTKKKMTVRGTMVRSEVCNSWCFCLES